MSIICRLVSIATREVEFEMGSDFDEKIDARLAGHLAEVPGATLDRDAYIQTGMDFLEHFPTSCTATISDIRETISTLDDEENAGEIRELEEIISGIQELEAESKQVNRAEFAAAIGKDWDDAIENMRWGSDFGQE